MKPNLVLILGLLALPLASCAPRAGSTEVTEVERSSRCITSSSEQADSVEATELISLLNATTSADIAKLEYALSGLDSDYTCGTLFYTSAGGTTRVIKVYRIEAPAIDITTRQESIASILRGYSSSSRIRLVVYAKETNGSQVAFISTGWRDDPSGPFSNYKAERLTTEGGRLYADIAATDQTTFLSDSQARSSRRTDLYNCSNFSSQAAAQAFFSSSAGDPNRLDADNDGVACEVRDNVSSTYRVAVAPRRTTTYTAPSYNSGRCYVSGYTRSNGTRVKGYYRRC